MQFRELTDRYQLEKILKSNRFGTVLRATDSKSGRTVVVKLITVPSPPRLVAGAPEFEKLAATLAGLGAPSLPAVLDSGFTTDGSAFLVLELLEGKGLDALGGAPPTRVLARIGQALDGLEALGAHGLAHLNLSPDNLFVVQMPAGERAMGRSPSRSSSWASAPPSSGLAAPRPPAAAPARTPASRPPSWRRGPRGPAAPTSTRSPSPPATPWERPSASARRRASSCRSR